MIKRVVCKLCNWMYWAMNNGVYGANNSTVQPTPVILGISETMVIEVKPMENKHEESN